MDNGTLALILTPISVILTGIITQWVVRRNARDTSEIDRFTANLKAYEGRATAAEERAINAENRAIETEKNAEARMVEVEKRVVELADGQKEQAKQIESQNRLISRMRVEFKKYINELKAAWTLDSPMPLPSKEASELFELHNENGEK